MTIPWILSHALSLVAVLKYPLISIGAFVEGPVVMIASGFLLRHHAFQLLPLCITLIIGDLIGDVLWYCIGYFLADPFLRKYGNFIGLNIVMFEKTKTAFLRHHQNILLVSKMTLGFGIAKGILMAAGAAQVPFKRFIILNFIGELVLVTLLLSIGYFFGDLYSTITSQYRPIFVILLITILVGILIMVSRFMRKTFLASNL